MTKPEKYSERLPHPVRGKGLCAAMDEDGVRCDSPATMEVAYHGEKRTEIAIWVTTYLCDYHGAVSRFELEGGLTTEEIFKKHRAGKLMHPNLIRKRI